MEVRPHNPFGFIAPANRSCIRELRSAAARSRRRLYTVGILDTDARILVTLLRYGYGTLRFGRGIRVTLRYAPPIRGVRT